MKLGQFGEYGSMKMGGGNSQAQASGGVSTSSNGKSMWQGFDKMFGQGGTPPAPGPQNPQLPPQSHGLGLGLLKNGMNPLQALGQKFAQFFDKVGSNQNWPDLEGKLGERAKLMQARIQARRDAIAARRAEMGDRRDERREAWQQRMQEKFPNGFPGWGHWPGHGQPAAPAAGNPPAQTPAPAPATNAPAPAPMPPAPPAPAPAPVAQAPAAPPAWNQPTQQQLPPLSEEDLPDFVRARYGY